MAIEAFSDFTITVSDCDTVPSLDYLANRTYVDIGSGNILKISWDTPTAVNNAVDSYIVYILSYDSNSASYAPFFTANIGCVNEYYLKSDLFHEAEQTFFQLHIYLEAVSKYGLAYNCRSNIEAVNVSRGCGIYTKDSDNYAQPLMKRSIAFNKRDFIALTDESGNIITDTDGNPFYIKVSPVQEDVTGWVLMQEFYMKDSTDAWSPADIRFEALMDSHGEIVTDPSNDTIYIL